MNIFNSLGNVLFDFKFIEKNGLFGFILMDKKNKVEYKSEIVYESIDLIGKDIKCFNRQPYFLIKENSLYGVFDPVQRIFIIQPQFIEIKLEFFEFEPILVGKSVIVMNEVEYFEYHFFDLNGNIKINEKYDDYSFIGYFGDTKNKLILVTQINKTVVPFVTTKKIISLFGKTVFTLNSNFNGISRIYENMMIVKYTNFENNIEVNTFDLISSDGILIDSNISFSNSNDYYII